jgi:hypothetical protein
MFHAGPLVRRRAPQVNTRGATMKNMVDYLDRKFREYYIPGRNICIDEYNWFQRESDIQMFQS